MSPQSPFRIRVDQIRRHLEQRIDQIWAIAHSKLPKARQIPFDGHVRFAIVTVNFSTTRWLKLLLLTLSEQDALDRVSDIIVVDNASRDGGRILIRNLAARVSRITLVENDRFLSHARGMRMRIRALDAIDSSANVVLSIDTDVIFIRPDMLSELGRAFEHGTSLAGEMRHGLYDVPEAQASFVAVRRDAYARRDVMPWVNHGAPSYWMQRSIRRAGLTVHDFPIYRAGYALHRGRGGVRAAKTFRALSSYASVSNDEPHFMGVPNGEATWRKVEAQWSTLVDPSSSDAWIDELSRRLR
jgi:glycosyltransferase involved in cell wall biosynthesis